MSQCFKNIDLMIQEKAEKSLQEQIDFFKQLVPILPQEDIDYIQKISRGNTKVAINWALEELI